MLRKLYLCLPVVVLGLQFADAQHGYSNTNINIYLNARPTYQSKMAPPNTSLTSHGSVDWGKTVRQRAETAVIINDAKDRSRTMNEQTANLRLKNEMLLMELIKRKKEQQQNKPRAQSLSQRNAKASQPSYHRDLIERANAGDINAQYERGQRCEQLGNSEHALNWFIRAGSSGHLSAQMAVGKYYLEGIHGKQSYEQALYWYAKAAEQGDPVAQLSVGTFYYLGWGCEANKSIAVDWIGRAAVQGNTDALDLIGISYFNGEGVEKDLKKAEVWFRQAASKGHANAQNGLGNTLCLLNENPMESFKWYLAAAQQGHSEAMLNVALQCYEGITVPKDIDAGLKWHRNAAASGYLDAQSTLAQMLAVGHILPTNKAEALKWAELAANQGDTQCMTLMAVEKMKGENCAMDMCEAYAWINASCFFGIDSDSLKLKQSILEQLSPAEMQKAQVKSKQLVVKLVEAGNFHTELEP